MVRIVRKINLVIVLIILTIFSLGVLYPLVYLVSGALSPGSSIASLNIIPFADGVTFEHFRHLFQETKYLIWFKNTFFIAASTSISTIIVASLGAYVFSRFHFVLRKSMMLMMLILQIFPSFVGMIAIYVILLRVNGFDQLWGLVLMYLAGNIPYNTWLVKSYIDTIPKSLDESARIDGANHLTVFWKIIMPIAKPIIIFLGVSSFTAPWMDFIFPKMILRSADKQTLALGLFSFVTDKKNEFSTFAAGSILIAIPFIIFFVISQKTMVTSFGGAAVKE